MHPLYPVLLKPVSMYFGNQYTQVKINTIFDNSASLVEPNGEPRDRFFYPTLTRIMDSFSCSPLFIFIYLFIYLFIHLFIYLFILK